MTFEEVSDDGALSGQIEWLTLGGSTRFEGHLTTKGLQYREVAHIRRGNVAIGSLYEIELGENEARGTWTLGQRPGEAFFQLSETP